MSKILDYLNEVDSNAVMHKMHEQDPRGTMEKYGLNGTEIDALLSKDVKTVAKLSGAEETEFRRLGVLVA